MSWVESFRGSGMITGECVRVSVYSDRRSHVFNLSISCELAKRIKFNPGDFVIVYWGKSSDLGKVRLVKDNSKRGQSFGYKLIGTKMLYVRTRKLPPGATNKLHPITICDHTVVDSRTLEIKLPPWFYKVSEIKFEDDANAVSKPSGKLIGPSSAVRVA